MRPRRLRRFVVDPACVRGGAAVVTGPARHHLIHVLRLGPGATVELLDGTGGRYTGLIEEVSAQAVIVRLGETRREPAAIGWVGLVYGLSRSHRTEWVLQKATELGVDAIVPCLCERSVARPRDADRKLERWREIVAQAARQSGRASLPSVSSPSPFERAVAEVGDADVRLIADPAGVPLVRFRDPLARPGLRVAVAVGPEGGLTEAEVARAAAAGFALVGLGPRTLRTETAAVAILAVVSCFMGRMGET